MSLPALPKSVMAYLDQDQQESCNGADVPELFDRRQWTLAKTGKRMLRLLSPGLADGGLESRPAARLAKMCEYVLTYQLDADQANFFVPAAAMALAGIIHSADGRMDYRYRYGMSRMCFGYSRLTQPAVAMSDLLRYVVNAAMEAALPVLPEAVELCELIAPSVPAGAPTFNMRGDDRQFLEGFDLDGPAAAQLARPLHRGHLPAARKIVTDYYIDKLASQQELLVTHQVDLTEADDLLKNVFILKAHMHRRHDFGPVVDWTTVLDADIESNVSINNHRHLLLLANAWKQTGITRYRDHLIDLILSWLQQSPMPNIKQSPMPNIKQSHLQWRSLEVGSRAVDVWPRILALGATDSVFIERLFYPMLRAYFHHADYLMFANLPHTCNWTEKESAGLLTVSLLLSEHRLAGLFRKTALRRFKYTNSHNYFPDGTQTELSIYYHNYALEAPIEGYRMLKRFGATVEPDWVRTIERGLEVLAYTALPDRTMPMISDTGPQLRYIDEAISAGRSIFPDHPVFDYLAGQAKTDRPSPPTTSMLFPHAGLGVMRENWTRHAQYLLFDNGFYGTNHQHEDKLNLIVYAYGRQLLCDPGIYRYSDDGFERYFRGSRGHNVVLIDGKGQRRDLFFDRDHPYQHVSFPDADSRWLDRPTHLLAQGAYRQGFAEKHHPLWYRGPRPEETQSLVRVEHLRKILWVKSRYWVIFDYLSGDGECGIEQVFHFAPLINSHDAARIDPGVVVLHSHQIAAGDNPGVANLAILQVGGQDLSVRKQKGRRHPMVGWTCLYGQNPAWDVTFETRRLLPTALVTVLLPLQPGRKIAAELRTLRQDSQVAVFDLLFDDRQDRIVLAAGEKGTVVEFDGCQFEGEALVLSKGQDEQFKLLLHEGGTKLVLKGRQISLPENR